MWRKGVFLIVIIVILFFVINFCKNKPWFSSLNSFELLSNYTESEIRHFSSFAFSSGRIVKWRNDIRISLTNDLSGQNSSELVHSINKCVNQLNGLLGEIRILIDSSDYNVILITKDAIDNGFEGFAPTYVSSYRIPYPTITSGEIEIVGKNRKPEAVNSTLYHEFTHILGFHHNLEKFEKSNWTYKSLFNPPSKTFNDSIGDLVEDFIEYSDLDKAAIRIMYDADVAIDPGLTKEKFYRLINEAKAEMAK